MPIDSELAAFRSIYEMAFRPFGSYDLESNWAIFVEALSDNIPTFNTFLYAMLDANHSLLGRTGSGVVIHLDWKASDAELVWAANVVLAPHGFDESFSWTFYDPGASAPEMGLFALDAWLEIRGHRLVNVATDGDYYLLLVVPSTEFGRIVALSDQVGPAEGLIAAPLHGIPDDWQNDPVPQRPKTTTPALFRLRWRTAGYERPLQGWSTTFANPAYEEIGDENHVAALINRFRSEHPADEIEAIEVQMNPVSEGTPDTWYVAAEVKRRLGRRSVSYWYMEHGELVSTTDLRTAVAHRSWTVAHDRSRRAPSERTTVMTVAEAASL